MSIFFVEFVIPEPQSADEEIWDEEESEILEELQLNEEEPAPVVDLEAQSMSPEAHSLSQCFLYFLFFMQAVFNLSDTVISFFCVLLKLF